MDAAELAIATKLATRMSDALEIELRAFIEAKRPEYIRSCQDYDLRQETIQSKKRDYGAALFFQFLRVDFFKDTQPEAFNHLHYQTVAKDIDQAILVEAIETIHNSQNTPLDG